MKVLNSIQVVVFLMLAPILLNLCRSATFTGAGVVFWVGAFATLVLSIATMVWVYEGLGK